MTKDRKITPTKDTYKAFHTIRATGQFSRIISNGKKYESSPLKVFVGKDSIERKIHLGIAIARTVRKAVDRNRLKRLIRESVRKNTQALSRCFPDMMSGKMILMYCGVKEIPHKLVKFQSIDESLIKILNGIREDQLVHER